MGEKTRGNRTKKRPPTRYAVRHGGGGAAAQRRRAATRRRAEAPPLPQLWPAARRPHARADAAEMRGGDRLRAAARGGGPLRSGRLPHSGPGAQQGIPPSRVCVEAGGGGGGRTPRDAPRGPTGSLVDTAAVGGGGWLGGRALAPWPTSGRTSGRALQTTPGGRRRRRKQSRHPRQAPGGHA